MNNVRKLTDPDLASYEFHQKYKDLTFINGKWFYLHRDSEGNILFGDIISPKPLLMKMKFNKKYHEEIKDYFKSTSSLDEFVESLKLHCSIDEETPKLWPMNEIQYKGTQEGDFPSEALKWLFERSDCKKLLALIYIVVYLRESTLIPIIYGEGNSGKSSFINIINQIYMNDFCSFSIEELGNVFNLREALRHTLISCTDISNKGINNSNFKVITEHEAIDIAGKFEKADHIQAQSNLIFSCNEDVPLFDITDTGYLRRFIYFKYKTEYTVIDPTISKRIYSKTDLINLCNFVYKRFSTWTKQELLALFKEDTYCAYCSRSSVYKFFSVRYKGPKDTRKNVGVYNEYNEFIKQIGSKQQYSFDTFCDIITNLESNNYL